MPRFGLPFQESMVGWAVLKVSLLLLGGKKTCANLLLIDSTAYRPGVTLNSITALFHTQLSLFYFASRKLPTSLPTELLFFQCSLCTFVFLRSCFTA